MRKSITVCGVPVSEADARNLVTTLVGDGTSPPLDLANRITTCLEMNVTVMALDAQERNTLLAVLEDPPDSLAGLRGVLGSISATDSRRPRRTGVPETKPT
jgi:hypothetical protein